MRIVHHHQFDGLEEIALVIDYDYQPEEPEVFYPVDDAEPGWPEEAQISSVCFNINGNFSDITGLISDEFMTELEAVCLEDFRGGE